MELFTSKDFKVFDIPGFEDRMHAIRTNIRPKLTGIGEELAFGVSGLVDQPVYVHVAKHARRTVNPPDDTWAALGADKRGYKKDVHFKVAVSRNCVRLLFEVGPEYYDKSEWVLKWTRDIRHIVETIGSEKKLAWFKDEHDEEPEAALVTWSRGELKNLGRELTRRRDGQLVIGRRVDREDIVGMSTTGFKRIAMGTFRSVAPLFGLHESRRVLPGQGLAASVR